MLASSALHAFVAGLYLNTSLEIFRSLLGFNQKHIGQRHRFTTRDGRVHTGTMLSITALGTATLKSDLDGNTYEVKRGSTRMLD